MRNSVYSVLIPARNEANYIATILKSLLSQTVPPSYILVISDGSTDDTVNEINEFSLSNDNKAKIELIERTDRGFSAVGTPYIAETYNDGFKNLEQRDEPFLMILGADSVLEMRYSEKLLSICECDFSKALSRFLDKPYNFGYDPVLFFAEIILARREAIKILKGCWAAGKVKWRLSDPEIRWCFRWFFLASTSLISYTAKTKRSINRAQVSRS